MNTADTIELVQRMNASGFQIKDRSCGVWHIMRGDTKYGECYSLEGIQGWFACWNAWVPDKPPSGSCVDARSAARALVGNSFLNQFNEG